MMNFNREEKSTRCIDSDWQSFPENAFSIDEENRGPTASMASPTKASSSRAMDCSFALPSPSKSRAFGDEMQSNCIIDTSLMNTINSCDASSTSAVRSDIVSTAAASDCGTETSSVAHLKGWLNGFGKQNHEHYSKNSFVGKTPSQVPLEKPPIQSKVHRPSNQKVPTANPYAAAPKMIKRMDSNSDSILKGRMNTMSYKPRIPKEDVQATDEGYASVAKLSAWLADDPTKTKKARPIRRGANVIAKSKQFDKELENVVFEENNVARANVENRKVWLEKRSSVSSAQTAQTSTASISTVQPSCSSVVREAHGAASIISVADKKKWLSHAFDNQKKSLTVKKSQTERKQDVALYSAKKVWQTNEIPPEQTYNSSLSASASQQSEDADESSIFRSSSTEHSAIKDEEPLVDFHAARRLLVERSKANGNDVEVLSKVHKRAAKFEKLDKESRRMSGPLTLLMPSWEEEKDGRHNSYVKKFVLQDVCPKKSIDQLP